MPEKVQSYRPTSCILSQPYRSIFCPVNAPIEQTFNALVVNYLSSHANLFDPHQKPQQLKWSVPWFLRPCPYGAAAIALACTGSVPVALLRAESSLPAVVESKV